MMAFELMTETAILEKPKYVVNCVQAWAEEIPGLACTQDKKVVVLTIPKKGEDFDRSSLKVRIHNVYANHTCNLIQSDTHFEELEILRSCQLFISGNLDSGKCVNLKLHLNQRLEDDEESWVLTGFHCFSSDLKA